MESIEGTMNEDEVLMKYSTPGLRRSELTRTAKKMNMEFDENYRHLTVIERNEILDKLFPEEPTDAQALRPPIE